MPVFSVRESDNDSGVCTCCCWKELAPLWPEQHKHANKSLSPVLQGEDKSQTPVATQGRTPPSVTTPLSVEEKGNSDRESVKYFISHVPRTWMIIFPSDAFDRLPPSDWNMAFFHPKVLQPVSIICKTEQHGAGWECYRGWRWKLKN